MTYLKSILHGTWTGGVAGFVGGGLFGAIFVIAITLSEGHFHEFGLGLLAITFYGSVIGLLFGLIAGAVCGLLLSTLINPRHAIRLGTIGGALVGTGIAASLQGIPWSTDWVEILTQVGLILLGTATGAFGGRLGGRLYTQYAS